LLATQQQKPTPKLITCFPGNVGLCASGKTVGSGLLITHSVDKKAGDRCVAAHFNHCGEKRVESMNSADVKTP